MPHAERGMAVGLFGGSFNPPHAGHVLVAQTALKRLGLQQIWWMVSPGNPLKKNSALPTVAERVQWSRNLITDRRIQVTGFEQQWGFHYTVDVLRRIKALNPHVNFIWIMGADSLRNFHHWHQWRWITETFPMAVVDRPGSTFSFLSSPMAKTFQYARIDERHAKSLVGKKAPAWVFLHGPRSTLSSTELRIAAMHK